MKHPKLLLSLFAGSVFSIVCLAQETHPTSNKWRNKALEKPTLKNCDVLTSEYYLREGALTDYWAQEMIGGDLLKQDIKQAPLLKGNIHLVSVWDEGEHGDLVTHLISAEGLSALLPPLITSQQLTHGYIPANSFRFYTEGFYLKEAKEALPYPPSFINSSRSYDEGFTINQTIYKSFAALSPHSILITAAGNSYDDTSPRSLLSGIFSTPYHGSNKSSIYPTDKHLSEGIDAIIVGSFNFDGLVSSFSQEGKEVEILAPSDKHISSVDKEGNYRKFGGTSGATPLVTASLAGFEWLSGWHPTAQQAKMILKKTAIPTIYSQQGSQKRNGEGLVNAYKLGQVALLLKDRCHQEDTFCFQREIERENIYQFSPYYPFAGEDDFQREIQETFPECAFGEENQKEQTAISCNDKKSVFNKLRKAALLNPSYKDLWETLACLYESNGYKENALGLRRLGTLTPEELDSIFNEITPEAAVRLAGNIGGETGARHLRRLLEEHPKDLNLVYSHIPYAAGIMGGQEGTAIAQHIFNLSDDSSLSSFAKRRAAYGLAENSDAESKNLLLQLEEDPEPDVRTAITYARGLSDGKTEELSSFFEKRFQDPDIEVKQAAVFGAGLTNDIDLLWHMLHEMESLEYHDKSRIKISLLSALESLSDRSVSSEIASPMLEDPYSSSIKTGAMIVRIRDDNIREKDILQKWMTDDDPRVRSELPSFLATRDIDKEISENILSRLLADPEPSVRAAGMPVIVSIFDKQAAEARLIQMEREETNPFVRKQIAKEIPKMLPYLNKEIAESIALRLTNPKETPGVRGEAAISLAKIDGEAAEHRLREMGINNPDPWVRNRVVYAVEIADMEEEIKEKILFDIAQAALASALRLTDLKEEPEVRLEAVISLAEIGGEAAERRLREMGIKDPDSSVRKAVAHAVATANMEEEKKGEILFDMAQKETNSEVKMQILSSAADINSESSERALEFFVFYDENPEIYDKALRILKNK